MHMHVELFARMTALLLNLNKFLLCAIFSRVWRQKQYSTEIPPGFNKKY